MLDWITNTIASLNYWGIVLLMLLENIFPPIPSEVIMPLAGFTTTQSELSFVWVVVAGTIGSILGALPWYYIGRRTGERRLRRWIDRRGRWLTLSGEDIDKSQRWFDRYGGPVVLFGRFVPGIRTLISVPAGLEEMPWLKFLVYSTIGTIGWNALLAYAGVLLGRNYRRIEQFVSPISSIVIAAIILGFGIWIVRRKKRQR